MKIIDGDHIVYSIMDETFYAIVKYTNPLFPDPEYITIQTIYSFYGIYDDGSTGLSPESELAVHYIKGVVPANLTKKEIFDKYPEYII